MTRDVIERFRDRIAELRRDMLCETDHAGLGAFSREHVRRGINELDQAASSLEIAAMLLGRGD